MSRYSDKRTSRRLLHRLEEISLNKDKYRRERLAEPKQQQYLYQKQTADGTTYCLEETEINQISEKLLPLYQHSSRDNIVFACSGYLHKCQILGDSINNIIHRLASDTNDEEYAKRLQAVKDTCAKNRDFVSGRNKFIEALTLVTNDGNGAREIVNSIGKIVSQARRNQGGESGLETDGNIDDQDEDDDLRGIDYDILQRLSPHVYSVVSSNPPVMYVAHKGKRKIIKANVSFFTETTTTTDDSNTKQKKKTRKQLLLSKQQLIFAIPIKVVMNDNPLDGSKTYQVTFTGRSKNPFTIGPGSIDYIIEELARKGKVLKKTDAVDALTAVLNRYEELRLAELKESVT